MSGRQPSYDDLDRWYVRSAIECANLDSENEALHAKLTAAEKERDELRRALDSARDSVQTLNNWHSEDLLKIEILSAREARIRQTVTEWRTIAKEVGTPTWLADEVLAELDKGATIE